MGLCVGLQYDFHPPALLGGSRCHCFLQCTKKFVLLLVAILEFFIVDLGSLSSLSPSNGSARRNLNMCVRI